MPATHAESAEQDLRTPLRHQLPVSLEGDLPAAAERDRHHSMRKLPTSGPGGASVHAGTVGPAQRYTGPTSRRCLCAGLETTVIAFTHARLIEIDASGTTDV